MSQLITVGIVSKQFFSPKTSLCHNKEEVDKAYEIYTEGGREGKGKLVAVLRHD